jgi:hypothetical protein
MSAAYKRSLFYFLLGIVNVIGLHIPGKNDESKVIGVFQVFVVLSSFVISVTNLCCPDLMVEWWFMMLDAIVFSSLWTTVILSLNQAMRGTVALFCLSVASAIFHFIFNFSSQQKFDTPTDPTISFSNTSMGASDFVFQENETVCMISCLVDIMCKS